MDCIFTNAYTAASIETAIPGATTTKTGKPFAGSFREVLLVLCAGVLFFAVGLRRRRSLRREGGD
jgi:hypothetical protein